MADFFKDPDHPNRPQHPDFHRLMEAVNYFDGESVEGQAQMADIAAAHIDPNSLMYMAVQRAMRAAAMTNNPVEAFASLWLEGVLVGIRFQSQGGHRDG
jgi:hypothetical protein